MKEEFLFLVGAQRCGTSLLAHTLDEHPDIKMARPFFPEPKFFLDNKEYHKGKDYYLAKYFRDRKEEKILGEKSTSYIESTEAAWNIKKMFPEAKIIISLRDPVERAISNYFYTRANKLENRSHKEAFLENRNISFDTNQFSVSPYDYLQRGKYINYIKEYVEIFGKENILVLIFEKLIKDKEESEKLFNFLKVKPIEVIQERINEGCGKEEISMKVIEYLRSYFQAPNKELEKYLEIDLSFWN